MLIYDFGPTPVTTANILPKKCLQTTAMRCMQIAKLILQPELLAVSNWKNSPAIFMWQGRGLKRLCQLGASFSNMSVERDGLAGMRPVLEFFQLALKGGNLNRKGDVNWYKDAALRLPYFTNRKRLFLTKYPTLGELAGFKQYGVTHIVFWPTEKPAPTVTIGPRKTVPTPDLQTEFMRPGSVEIIAPPTPTPRRRIELGTPGASTSPSETLLEDDDTEPTEVDLDAIGKFLDAGLGAIWRD
jgi:hypothetical protein